MRIAGSPRVLIAIGALAALSIPFLLVGTGLVPGPFDQTPERWQNGVEVIVFLNPGASEAETESMRSTLTSSSAVDRFSFVSKVEAYAEFLSEFEDSSQIQGSVEVADMPPSFRIVPTSDQSDAIRMLADSFRDDPGVFEVIAAADVSGEIEQENDGMRDTFLGVGLVLLVSTILVAVGAIVVLQRHDGDPASR